MSRFIFSGGLDETTVKSTELDVMFADLESFFDAPNMTSGNIEHNGLHYRHIKQIPRIELADTFESLGAASLTLSAAFGGYYAITDAILKFNIASAGMNNIHETNMPVFNCSMIYYQSDVIGDFNQPPWSVAGGTSQVTRVCLGYSTDNGATWVPLTGQSRPTRDTCGNIPQWFTGAGGQPNYMHTVGHPWPPNANRDRGVVVVASFGGAVKSAASTGPVWVAPMINHTTYGESRIFGVIEGNARWTA